MNEVVEPPSQQRSLFLRVLDSLILQYVDDDEPFAITLRKMCIFGMAVGSLGTIPFVVYFFWKYGHEGYSGHNAELQMPVGYLIYTVSVQICYMVLRQTREVSAGMSRFFYGITTAAAVVGGGASTHYFPLEASLIVLMLTCFASSLGAATNIVSIAVGFLANVYVSATKAWPDIFMVPNRHYPGPLEAFFANSFNVAVFAIAVMYAISLEVTFGSKVVHMAKAKRDNSKAPTDPEKPVVMMFTDIQSSTNLWAAAPEIMAGALEAHNAVLRDSIAANNGYEVKTVGDAFVVVFHSVDDALAAGLAAQQALFRLTWLGGTAIDSVYQELESE